MRFSKLTASLIFILKTTLTKSSAISTEIRDENLEQGSKEI